MARSARLTPSLARPRRLAAARLSPLLAPLLLALPAALLGAAALSAQPALPPQLAPWVPWVLESHPELACPLAGEERFCAWPGVLRLDLGESGGSFELRVFADRPLDLPLPGNATVFPREVSVDGRPALLRRLGGGLAEGPDAVPALALPAGEHLVRGAFRWPRLPESLPLPREIAIVDLRLAGQRVPRPHREAGGLLWLEAREAAAGEEDGLSIEVYRKIADGVPALLETRLLLRVSGAARELDLGEPLPPEFEPYELASDLPARYGRDRRLRVQLRAGEWSLRLSARSRGPLAALAGRVRPAPWPEEEIWVFAADPAVRAVRVDGAAGIDPQRTSLPAEWKSLPAFQIAGEQALRFEELRRGEPQPPPDEIAVSRIFWLAERGDRLTSRDHLRGVLHQGGRLEALPPAVLGRAALADPAAPGGRADQVITRSPEGGADGVEVRSGSLDLEADAVYQRSGGLPAVGWNRDASQLEVELRVPPGWSLLAAGGADVTSGAWVDRWSLLDFFLLLILVLATFKLAGAAAGGVALLTLTLSWHEQHAAALVWLLLGLLALRGLSLMRPEGAPRRVLRLLVTASLLALLVLFVRWQWRIGRFPQLDEPYAGYGSAGLWETAGEAYSQIAAPQRQDDQQESGQAYDSVNAPAAAPEDVADGRLGGAGLPNAVAKSSYPGSLASKRTKQADPNAVVQTGPGVPAWQWRSYRLSWQGPVKADQALRLHLISPGMGFLLAILRIAGWLALLGLLLGWPRPLSRRPRPAIEDEESPGNVPSADQGSTLRREGFDPAPRSHQGGSILRISNAAGDSGGEILSGSTLRHPEAGGAPAGAAHSGAACRREGVGCLEGRASDSKPRQSEKRGEAEGGTPSPMGSPPLRCGEGAGGEVFQASSQLGRLIWRLAAGALALALLAAPARAQTPEQLAELERRLTLPPECSPNCLELARLDLFADAGGLRIEAEIHAAAKTAWALPGPASSFVPAEVTLDGRPAAAMRLQEDGFLALRLERGVHRVTLRGPARDSVSLQFPLPPRLLGFAGQGFTIDGLSADEPPPGLVRIDRTLPSGEDSPAAAAELAPWLELGRRLDIGLPWMVHYQLRRLSPPGAAVLLRVPLLPGEAVTSAGVPVENGEALVSLEPGESLREWSTTLAERPSLILESPLGRPWLERWELLCSPIWHCTATGLDPVRHMADGEWRPEWRPFPGEQLALGFVRPEGAPGQTTTLDRVSLFLEPGRRLLEGRLLMEARASRGGEHRVGLPADAELLGFTVDGNAVPVQNLGGKVSYTLEPGSRSIELRWRQDHQAGLFEKMPAIEVPGEAANLMIEVTLPQHRWMLFTGGPDWGPVVLFWQDLIAVLIAAALLGRFAPTPLRTLDWALLLAGLTQVPFAAAAVVVAWLFLLGFRSRPPRPWQHDLFQLLLLALGLAVLIILYAAIHSGLLMQPDMQVAGAGSQGSTLRWIAERVNGTLPQPWLIWVPIGVYRVVMLLWALWLAARLLRWLPWCWQQLHRNGKLFQLPAAWRARRERQAAERQARMPPQPPPA